MLKSRMKLSRPHLFVDASGWIAYLDTLDLNHKVADARIRNASGQIVTSDYELEALTNLAENRIENRQLASLVWQL